MSTHSMLFIHDTDRVVDAKDVVLVHPHVEKCFGSVLDEEPAQGVGPHQGGHGRRDVVHALAEGPREGEDRGEAHGEHKGAGQRLARALHPEGPVCARGEQRQEVRDGHLQVHHTHHLGEIQRDAELGEEGPRRLRGQGQVQQEHRGDAGHGAQGGGHAEDHRQVPLLGIDVVLNIVVGDGDDCAVVQQRDGDQGQHGHAPEVVVAGVVVGGVDEEHGPEEEHEQLERAGHPVDDEGLHAREDPPGHLDGLHDGHQALLRQHNVRGGARSVRGAGHRDADVRLLERGRVVDAVARHAAHEPLAAQRLHEDELVLGEHLGEAVALDDLLRDLVHVGGQLPVGPQAGQALAAQDVVPHAQLPRGLARDGRVVARDHLHLHAVLARVLDGLLGVRPRGVQEGQDAQHEPLALRVGARHRQGPDAPLGQLQHLEVHGLLDALLVVA
mmetsp:Transcript_18575/g.29037  ORF Transcript_18575/g.29037 Transcript_18575/m.29037 type:complete len:442 (+) Transcript_18575:350-1675(+)